MNKMEFEEFKELAKEVKPLLEEAIKILKKHETKGLASVTLGVDGYMDFIVFKGGMEMCRVDEDAPTRLSCNLEEREILQ